MKAVVKAEGAWRPGEPYSVPCATLADARRQALALVQRPDVLSVVIERADGTTESPRRVSEAARSAPRI